MAMERIRELREQKKLYQKDMAKILNIKQTTYSKYELGRVNIPLEQLNRIADILGTSTDYLLMRTDVKEPYPVSRRKRD